MVKKFVVAILTGAFAAGATSVSLAAANPFSDVPAGHWAYNAVGRLSAEGVIEGYGDNTYRGSREITRYEMAQMIARALAKNPAVTGTARSDLDKLAAEFREELDGLGVRVAELEKHSDMVRWNGEIRYSYWNDSITGRPVMANNQLQFRLYPTAAVNEHWKAKARVTAIDRNDTVTDLHLTYIYAEGDYDKFGVKLGKLPLYTVADDGLVIDDYFSGGQVSFGSKLKFLVNAGRWSGGDDTEYIDGGLEYVSGGEKFDYVGGEILYDDEERFNIGVGYHKFDNYVADNGVFYGDDDEAKIWAVGVGYKFGRKLKLSGAYAKNTNAEMFGKGHNIELDYAGADKDDPGSWGAYLAYRYIGQYVGLATTYDTFERRNNKKGIEVGATWSPLKNTYMQVSYFNGNSLANDKSGNTFFGQASVFF